MERRICIDLNVWEDSVCPICTDYVNLAQAERELFDTMLDCYVEEEIENYLKEMEKGNFNRDVNKFSMRLSELEEKAILNNGGFYYEDMQ